MTVQAWIVITESTGAKLSPTDLASKKDALYPLNIQYPRPWTQVYKKHSSPLKDYLTNRSIRCRLVMCRFATVYGAARFSLNVSGNNKLGQ